MFLDITIYIGSFDYESFTKNISITPNDNFIPFNVVINDDFLQEPSETFTIHLTVVDEGSENNPISVKETSLVTILDNDVIIQFVNTIIHVKENTPYVEFCLEKSDTIISTEAKVKLSTCKEHIDEDEYDFAESGFGSGGTFDYIGFNEIITFVSNSYKECANITLLDDIMFEMLEAFGGCITPVTDNVEIGPNNTAVVVIIDDEGTSCCLNMHSEASL